MGKRKKVTRARAQEVRPDVSPKKQIPTSALVLGLLLLALTALGPVLLGGFTNWDDPIYLVNNPMVKSLSWSALGRCFTTPVSGHYHPLVMITFLLEHAVFGLWPPVYHATNLLLHLANALLVFYLLYLLSENRWVAAVGAGLFAVHPLQVESVAWISERKNVLATLFFLMAAISYLWYQRDRQQIKWYGFCLLFFLLGLLSKAVVVILPLVLVLCDFIQERRWERAIIIEKIPMLILAGFFSVLAFTVQYPGGREAVLGGSPWTDRLLVAVKAFVFYLGKTLGPWNLSALYLYPEQVSWTHVSFWGPAVIFLVLVALVTATLRFTRKIAFGFLFFGLTLAPMLQLVPVGKVRVLAADRYVYVALIGLGYLAGWGVVQAHQRLRRKGALLTSLVPTLVVLIFAGMGFLSWERTRVWRNSETLWRDVLEKYPQAYTAHNSLAEALIANGDLAAALEEAEKAVALAPRYAFGHNSLGVIHLNRGDSERAIAAFRRALAIEPNFVRAYHNLAVALADQGQMQEAHTLLQQVRNKGLANAETFFLDGNIYARKGDYEQAVRAYHNSLRHDPHDFKIFFNLANTYRRQGNLAKALAAYEQALVLNPGSSEAYYNMGLVYERQDQLDQALVTYKQALAIRPNYPEVHNNLAVIYYFTKKYGLAVQHADTARRLGYPVHPQFLDLLEPHRR